jgi:hypothetical protein
MNLVSAIVMQKESVVQSMMVTFNVSHVNGQAYVAVIVSDDYGERAGNVTVQVAKLGLVSVDLRKIVSSLISVFQRDFIVRAIRGNILRVSLETTTPNIAVNVMPDVSISMTIYQQTSVPSQTPTNTATPTQTPKDPGPFINDTPMWIAIALSVTVIAGIVMTGVILLIISVVRARRNKRRPVEMEIHELDDSTSYVRLTE